jgi:hypothetical protein
MFGIILLQEAFSAAKMAFRQFKMKTRANLAKTHYGPETLEEAVQDYINRNTDLVDTPGLVSVSELAIGNLSVSKSNLFISSTLWEHSLMGVLMFS